MRKVAFGILVIGALAAFGSTIYVQLQVYSLAEPWQQSISQELANPLIRIGIIGGLIFSALAFFAYKKGL